MIFTNLGVFIPQSIENVIKENAPQETYRNPFLVTAMFNLKMVDTIGSGIRRMFNYQRIRFFPMPDYDFSENRVKLTITGKVLDIDYAKILARNPDLTLEEIILLDKVQKKKKLKSEEIAILKGRKLIEGRKPNFIISASVAEKTGQKANYTLLKGIDDDYCKKIIEDYLIKFKKAKNKDLKIVLIINKLPDRLSYEQKTHKIKNLLQAMKKEQRIKIDLGRCWILNNPL